MSTSLLYHAFGIRGYQYTRTDYHDGQTIFTIHQEPETCHCSACGSDDVQMRGTATRCFRALSIGSRPTVVVLPVPRVECRDCGVVRLGKISFWIMFVGFAEKKAFPSAPAWPERATVREHQWGSSRLGKHCSCMARDRDDRNMSKLEMIDDRFELGRPAGFVVPAQARGHDAHLAAALPDDHIELRSVQAVGADPGERLHRHPRRGERLAVDSDARQRRS